MVVGIVEGWTYEVCHAGIENDKLTVCGLLDIKTFGNERTALTHDGASQFEVELLKGFKLIPAKVVSNSLSRHDNLITIDKGEAEGVRKDMGVVCGSGVVGIVYLTSAHYAVVIPLLNDKSNVSCRIRGRGYFGYLHWNGGDTRLAYVEDVPRHARFRLYDDVETSGFSSVFPPGVLVGKILHVYNSVDGVSYRLQVRCS